MAWYFVVCLCVCGYVCVCRLLFNYSLTLMFLLSVAQFCQRLFSSCNIRAAAFKSIHCLGWKKPPHLLCLPDVFPSY